MSIDVVPISQSGAFGSDPAWGRDFSPVPFRIFSALQTQVYPLLASIQNGIEVLAPFARASLEKWEDGTDRKNSLTGLPYRYVPVSRNGQPEDLPWHAKLDLTVEISETQIDIDVLRAIGGAPKPPISQILRQSDASESFPSTELATLIDMVDKYEELAKQIIEIEKTRLSVGRPLIVGNEATSIRFINNPKYSCETPYIHTDGDTSVLTLANKPELSTRFFNGLPNQPVYNPNYRIGKAEVGLFHGQSVTHSKPEISDNEPMHRIAVIGTFSRPR